jgi:hypothetical protein
LFSIKIDYLQALAKSDSRDFHGTAFPAAMPWIFFALPENQSFQNFRDYINSKFPALWREAKMNAGGQN